MFNILVVEDDVSTRKLLTDVLKDERYLPVAACDAQEALDILDHQHIDLMITDIMMPGMDGFSLTESLREAGYDFPILMMTAKETIRDKRKGFLVGTDDYMVKPFDPKELIARVKAVLRRNTQPIEEEKVKKGFTLEQINMKVFFFIFFVRIKNFNTLIEPNSWSFR